VAGIDFVVQERTGRNLGSSAPSFIPVQRANGTCARQPCSVPGPRSLAQGVLRQAPAKEKDGGPASFWLRCWPRYRTNSSSLRKGSSVCSASSTTILLRFHGIAALPPVKAALQATVGLRRHTTPCRARVGAFYSYDLASATNGFPAIPCTMPAAFVSSSTDASESISTGSARAVDVCTLTILVSDVQIRV
jgi:hypothetical protein